MGIEPTFLAWEATFLPLEDTRVQRFYGDVRACAKQRRAINRARVSLCHTRDRLLDCVRTATTSACSTRA